jgi:hypothetical protein
VTSLRRLNIALLLAAAASSLAARTSHAQELFSFEPTAQSRDQAVGTWNAIAEDRRGRIQQYLMSLGLSSTGVIRLIGVYRKDESGSLLHFQQLDLHGSRLFWSVLIDPEDMSGRVIYHVQHARVSGSFGPISTAPLK